MGPVMLEPIDPGPQRLELAGELAVELVDRQLVCLDSGTPLPSPAGVCKVFYSRP